jgi:hypothetical protein
MDENALEMLLRLSAISYIGLSLVAMVFCGCMLRSRCTKNNMTLLILYAIVGGTGTVVNTSIAKLTQRPIVYETKWLFCSLMVVYLLLAVLCLCTGAAANAELEDPAAFVPISNGVNLILNCLAGICIWGDWGRLEYPLAYCVIYVLVALGTYLISTMDFLSQTKHHVAEQKVALIKHVYRRMGTVSSADNRRYIPLDNDPEPSNRVLLPTLSSFLADGHQDATDTWALHNDPDDYAEAARRGQLRTYLTMMNQRGIWEAAKLIDRLATAEEARIKGEHQLEEAQRKPSQRNNRIS